MEFLAKLDKKELKCIIEKMIDKIKDSDLILAEECEKLLDKYLYTISLDEAKDIVYKMIPCGEVYSYETIVELLKKHGNYNEETEPTSSIEYYLVMNMFHNDYKTILEKYNVVNSNQFCYDLSKCFINDEDKCQYKVAKYFLMLK